MGQFTITADVGEYIQLGVEVTYTPTVGNYNELSDILWDKLGIETTEILPFAGKVYQIPRALEEHAGVYYAYWRDFRNNYVGYLFRLIVRGK